MDVRIQGNGLVVTAGREQNERSILEVLTEDLLLPLGFLKDKFHRGEIKLKMQPATFDSVVGVGDKFRLDGGVIEPPGLGVSEEGQAQAQVQAQDPITDISKLDVLYEDDHLLVVNKPAAMIVYPGDEDADELTLGHLVAAYFQLSGQQHKIRHVHRLDRDTTGTVLYAKHAYSARALDSLLASHKIGRTYLTLVVGDFRRRKGTITAPIGRDRHVAGRYRVSKTGKPATTHFHVLGTVKVGNTAMSLVKCQLETGRTHQIRVHMAESGHPVVGDTLYGAGHGIGDVKWNQGYALHAFELAFSHPYTGEALNVIAPLHGTFDQVLHTFGLGDVLTQYFEIPTR